MDLEGKGRGASPRDHDIFSSKMLERLREATLDMSFLIARDYAEASALKVVGDRYQLHQRQRLAVLRSASSAKDIAGSASKRCGDLRDQILDIDTLNLVILLESALGGGVLLKGMDGCYRDLASVHGTYRMVEQTGPLLRHFGRWLAERGVVGVRWWIDQPVSNSGRLASLLREIGEEAGWPWEAQTTPYVDREVAQAQGISISTDKVILRHCRQWNNAGREFVEAHIPEAWVFDLGISPLELASANL